MQNIPNADDIKSIKPIITSLDFIDSGGFKAVYRAIINGTTEALKLIYLPPNEKESDHNEKESDREEIIARTQREIEALNKCNSPRLVKLGSFPLELMSIGGHDYLIYSEEFIIGESLESKISADYRPNYNELYTLTKSLMEALTAIEKINHIHRDIKPANIMKTNDPNRSFILLDLGVAYKIRGTDLTGHRGPPGTLIYMAPELLQPDYKNSLDIRSDIYSAGVTIYEYASDKHPLAHPREDVGSTIYRILEQRPSMLIELRPDLPQEFCDIIDRCIKKLPALRFPNPRVVLNTLEELL